MFVRQLVSVALVAIGLVEVTPRPVMAQDGSLEATPMIDITSTVASVPMAVAAGLAENAAGAETPKVEFSPGKRPAWFIPIHVFSVAVQALDAHSTFAAFRNHSVDTSPLQGRMSGSKLAFVAVKAGMAAALVYATDRLSKRHRIGAVVTAAAFNSVYLTVAAHNYNSARSRQARFGR